MAEPIATILLILAIVLFLVSAFLAPVGDWHDKLVKIGLACVAGALLAPHLLH